MKSSTNSHWFTSRTLVKALLICLAAWGFVDIFIHLLSFIRGPESTALIEHADLTDCNCGETIAEAKTKGCKFDALASAWLPAECIDEELSNEFDHSGPEVDGSWPYFLHPNGTVPLSMDDLASMANTGQRWYSTREWHLLHCNFYWRKKTRSAQTGVVLEKRYDTVDHIAHCWNMVMMTTPMDSLTVNAKVVLFSGLK